MPRTQRDRDEDLHVGRQIERDIAVAVAAERERCAKLVPTNWCDPLLTGPDAPKHPLDSRGVEDLLRGIQDRIRNQPQ